jgi:CRP/FNR family cyclic AMP-dependent transcriptional regulator
MSRGASSCCPRAAPCSPAATILALDDARLLALRERHIAAFVRHQPDRAIPLLAALARQSEAVAEAACERALMNSRQRVLRTLVRLCERHGTPDSEARFVQLSLTQRDLADLTGCCRETVSSIMAELGRAGMATTSRGTVRIDRERVLDALDLA